MHPPLNILQRCRNLAPAWTPAYAGVTVEGAERSFPQPVGPQWPQIAQRVTLDARRVKGRDGGRLLSLSGSGITLGLPRMGDPAEERLAMRGRRQAHIQ
jgi:hypothetical protein